MNDLANRIAALSPEKRALLTLRLEKRRAQVAKKQAIPRRDDTDSFPLSFAQQRLWFLDQFEPGSPFYNIPAAVRLTGPLNVAALEHSLNEIVRRHEVLRATFVAVKGQPVQVIAPAMTVITPKLTPALPVTDLRHLPQEAREEEALRLSTQEARQPFELAQGPLLRARLLRLDEEEHILLLTMHHTVFDGWSTGVLARELSALYDTFSQVSIGHTSPLPELPIQYADYADWQRQWLQGEVLEEQLAYWRQRLGDAPPVLELPTDYPRPPVQTYQGAHHAFELGRSLYEQLKTLSQQEGVTLFMTLLGAFQTLLFRYTRQENISVGTPVANRTRVEVEDLIGFFVNTLVMRVDLSGEPTFRELLKRVRKATLEAQAHQDVPFEMLVDALRPERDMSHTPLFQVMFDLQKTPLESLQLGELELGLLEVETGIAKFDWVLMMEEGTDGLKGVLEYNTDLFEAATIERLAQHFRVLLEGIVTDPDQPISILPLLTAVERQQLVGNWRGTKTAYPREQTIHQLFEAQVEQTPDTIAVIFEGEQLTYQELNRRANQLAHRLQSLGVGPEVLVGILMERSLEMVVAHVGVLKAGGAYLPLDPEYPQERLAFMLKDGEVPVLLTQERMFASLPECDAEVICLDAAQEIAECATGEENPFSGATADNLAYVMYTSGSTGRPKGVSVIHRGVVRLVKETTYADLSADEVFVQLAPISFDASTLEIWGPLLNGGRLVVMPAHTPSLAEIGQALERYQVTILWLTSSLFHLMVDERLDDLNHVRQLLAGGDVLSVSHVRKVVEELDGVRMINGYGPTENTTFSTCYPVTDPHCIRKSVPIGRPIANTRVLILDALLQPVQIGVPGELYVGGDGLARGYLNRPELTAERFIPNPLSDEPGARLYDTGDVARYLLDGNIEFLGRKDYQVKIRGFRIELGEIQTVLGQHPGVRDVVVLARADTASPTDKRLVAYVVPEEAPPSAGDQRFAHTLRDFLRKKLPEYMVPSAFVFLDGFPLSPAGKVDRRALPAPDWSSPELERAFIAPRSPVEKALADAWSRVLGVEQIGVHDDFFELGGHSLLATQLISRVRDAFQVEVPLRDLFETPTVAGLAEKIETFRWAAQSPQVLPLAGSGDREEGVL